MDYYLSSIKDFIQQVVEAIALIMRVDITVIDANRNMVGSSAGSRDPLGPEYFHHGSLTDRLLKGEEKCLISRNPGCEEACRGCKNYGTCQHLFVAVLPIKLNDIVIGSFCVVATTVEQRNIMLKNESQVLQFLDKITTMIESVINERLIQNKMTALLKRYNYVINSMHEGLIATNSDNKIIHMNNSASELLELEKERVLEKSIFWLFPDLNLSSIDDNYPLETELYYRKNSKSKKKGFLATVVPILGKNKAHMGINITIRNLRDVQSYASTLMGNFSKYSFNEIQGNSMALKSIKDTLHKAALTDSTIMLRGESGTGKELFAHAVHTASYRANKNFIVLNCSAIPESLLESELFGYEEGAFTGAKKGGKPGKFELARGGTIFLDEIGDMPLHLQCKLLRVLENRVVERVGGIEPIPIDVRIITATNRNLEEMIENHEFRDDLYYRISVIPVFIPPLRDREGDIPLLIDYFLVKYSNYMKRHLQTIDPEAREILTNYSWPGNIRELQNTIEYAINVTEENEVISIKHLPKRLFQNSSVDINLHQDNSNSSKVVIPYRQGKLKSMEKETIRQALDKFGTTTKGKAQAAAYLGISIATLYRRLKDLNP